MNVLVKIIKCLFIITVLLSTISSTTNIRLLSSNIYFGERFLISGIANVPSHYSISLWKRFTNDSDSSFVESLISNLCEFDIPSNNTIDGDDLFTVPCNCISSQRPDIFLADKIQYLYLLYQVSEENQFKKEVLRLFVKDKPLTFSVEYFNREPNFDGKFNKLHKSNYYSVFVPIYAKLTLFLNDTNQLKNCSRISSSTKYDELRKNESILVELRYHSFETLHRPILSAFVASPSALSDNANSVDVDYLYDNGLPKDSIKYSQLIDSKIIIFSRKMNTTVFEFECWHFIRPGYYTIRTTGNGFKMMDNKWISINKSKSALHEELHSSHKVDLEAPLTLLLRNDSIFPNCVNELTLSWRLPSTCSASMIYNKLDFRIRVFALATPHIARHKNSASNFPYSSNSRIEYMHNFYNDNWIYLHEFFANDVTKSLLAIPCSHFDIIHEKFCFELVSVERSTQHFELWDRKCVNTEPIVKSSIITENASSNIGIWSDWSEWSSCFIRRKHQQYVDKIWNCVPFLTAPSKNNPGKNNKSVFGYRKRYRECLLTPNEKSNRRALCENGIIAEKEECQCSQLKNGIQSSSITRTNHSKMLTSILFKNNSRQSFDSLLIPNVNFQNSATSSNVNCSCGCNFTQDNGAFYAGSKDCINSIVVWTISAGESSLFQRQNAEIKHLIRLTIIKKQDIVNCAFDSATLHVFRSSPQENNQLELIWTSETQIMHTANGNEVNTDLLQKNLLIEKLSYNHTIVIHLHSQRNANPDYSSSCGFYVDYQLLNDINHKNFVDVNIHNVYSAARNFITQFFNKFGLTLDCRYPTSLPTTAAQLENQLMSATFRQNQEKCEIILILSIIGFAAFILAVILVLPLFLCVILTNRLGLFSPIRIQNKIQQKKHSANFFFKTSITIDDEKLIQDPLVSSCSQRSDMLRSGDTNCTQLTGCSEKEVNSHKTRSNVAAQKDTTMYITKRSIGIQLSRQSTPRLPSRNAYGKIRRKKSGTFDRSNSATLNENLSASTSAAPITVDDFPDDCCIESGTEDGLEYDYYEPPPPLGSFLCSAQQLNEFELLSEIDIDEIVRQKAFNVIKNSNGQDGNNKWHRESRFSGTTHEAHTQISEFEENCVMY